MSPVRSGIGSAARGDGLTHAEGAAMDALVSAVNAFGALEREHPQELEEFVAGVHACQHLLAVRIARRHFPLGWPRKIPATLSGPVRGECNPPVTAGEECSPDAIRDGEAPGPLSVDERAGVYYALSWLRTTNAPAYAVEAVERLADNRDEWEASSRAWEADAKESWRRAEEAEAARAADELTRRVWGRDLPLRGPPAPIVSPVKPARPTYAGGDRAGEAPDRVAAVYDPASHTWTPACPYGDDCSGCDTLGRCTRYGTPASQHLNEVTDRLLGLIEAAPQTRARRWAKLALPAMMEAAGALHEAADREARYAERAGGRDASLIAGRVFAALHDVDLPDAEKIRRADWVVRHRDGSTR